MKPNSHRDCDGQKIDTYQKMEQGQLTQGETSTPLSGAEAEVEVEVEAEVALAVDEPQDECSRGEDSNCAIKGGSGNDSGNGSGASTSPRSGDVNEGVDTVDGAASKEKEREEEACHKGKAKMSSAQKRNTDVQAFDAISTFIRALADVFQTPGVTPLALYNRLIDHIRFSDKVGLNNSISGFRQFYKRYGDMVKTENLRSLPRGACIPYGDGNTVRLELGQYVASSDDETLNVIRHHLLTIYAILEDDVSQLEELEARLTSAPALPALDTSSNEGKFIRDLMHDAEKSMEDIDASNPGAAIMGIFNSGLFEKMMGRMQSGLTSGDMDMGSLMGSMQGMLGSMMGGGGGAAGGAEMMRHRRSVDEIVDQIEDGRQPRRRRKKEKKKDT